MIDKLRSLFTLFPKGALKAIFEAQDTDRIFNSSKRMAGCRSATNGITVQLLNLHDVTTRQRPRFLNRYCNSLLAVTIHFDGALEPRRPCSFQGGY